MIFKFTKVCDASDLKLVRGVEWRREVEREGKLGVMKQPQYLSPELASGPRPRGPTVP